MCWRLHRRLQLELARLLVEIGFDLHNLADTLPRRHCCTHMTGIEYFGELLVGEAKSSYYSCFQVENASRSKYGNSHCSWWYVVVSPALLCFIEAKTLHAIILLTNEVSKLSLQSIIEA
ncbi:hypothetical protein N431DRAFT_27205 [Stipitochalara longipes BDJ]|nr:hypothetical protein N431DRAFT_27205 [Stipitochalara longipes BDJ]